MYSIWQATEEREHPLLRVAPLVASTLPFDCSPSLPPSLPPSLSLSFFLSLSLSPSLSLSLSHTLTPAVTVEGRQEAGGEGRNHSWCVLLHCWTPGGPHGERDSVRQHFYPHSKNTTGFVFTLEHSFWYTITMDGVVYSLTNAVIVKTKQLPRHRFRFQTSDHQLCSDGNFAVITEGVAHNQRS